MADGLTFVSLYSGAGGLDIGFSRAGFTPIWANDIDVFATRTYNHLFVGHKARAGDIREQELPERHSARVVIGGPPCQGFSVAGRMDPNDPRSRHVWDFLGVVKRVEPDAFVMENVKALAKNRRWSDLLNRLRDSAEQAGYTTELHVLNASHYGVPQARERMFLVGTRAGRPLTIPPVSTEAPPSVRSALLTLPPYKHPGNHSVCTARVTPARTPVMRKSPFAGMLFNGQGRPLNLDAPAPTLPASMGGNRTPIIDQHQLDDPEADSWVISYHRHLAQGGVPYDAIPQRMRRLTVQEAAAIQTFPPGMTWEGKQSAQFRQIGNAVPPTLAFHVARALRRALEPASPATPVVQLEQTEARELVPA